MRVSLLCLCLIHASQGAFELKSDVITGLEDANDTRYKDWNRYISKDRLRIVDVTDIKELEDHCSRPFGIFSKFEGAFHSCTGSFSTVKLMKSGDRSDITPWVMPLSSIHGDNMSQPELSRTYAPHLVAVRDAFLSPWGYIFDFKRWYLHGGCSDKSYYSPNFDYDMTSQGISRFEEPVLNLVHPYPGLFYHEFVEIHASLLMSLPLIKMMPNITIILTKSLQQKQIFPLLKIL